ncbi:MAG TPA: KUP/HAK/KT family potassium transporter, partial [Bacteroidales bacterium]|nr:KUP/HAK/KT family potassium transporter [Bacteroidales bacterium]
MKEADQRHGINKLSFSGLLITLGIVFGDIGTSPLYTMKAIITGAENLNESLILGSLSCIFWTLTLQTTIKYVIITLSADNKGEGGIFALFALLRKKSTWAAILTMIGGGALLADGVITPAITVTSSIEGLKLINPGIHVIPIVLFIFFALFFVQQYGTKVVGGIFGPVMLIWFLMLGSLGFSKLFQYPDVLRALNPVYAVRFLTDYPGGFVLLGAVFLCTTGAEAMYSDLGHCGKTNIRVSWIFVKTMLLLNYFGQGAWLMMNLSSGSDAIPFFEIMPGWFLIPGIIISTAAAIIASQALISGSFTLLSEAVSLNFWPKIKITNPTSVRGQVYLPSVNWSLLIMSSLVVIFFRESANMGAAYGLAITITMIMTTLLLSGYHYQRGKAQWKVILMLVVFITIEGSFLITNLNKFKYGGWVTLLLASIYFLSMFGWYFGRKIKNRYISFVKLSDYLESFRDLRNDVTVPKTATNLVCIIKANDPEQVESKVIYSIFQKQPKRADKYWLLHIDRVEDPNRFEYKVNQIIPGILIRVDFHLGFKVDPKINLYFREVLEDLTKSGEITLDSSYNSLRKHGFPGDFKFLLIERIMPRDFKLSKTDNFILLIRDIVQHISIPDVKALQLDSTNTVVEQVPIIIDQPV